MPPFRMNDLEYLAGYGLAGDFGRFRAAQPLPCQRGERVVVRSHRGLELARILRPASPRHATFLPNTTVGQLLRRAGSADDEAARQMQERAGRLLTRAQELSQTLGLPLSVLDAEMLLDGVHAVLHQVRRAECDLRSFVSTLSREFEAHLLVIDLNAPAPVAEEEPSACGSCESGGGCGSCGTGGGCGSCASSRTAVGQSHFAGLREQMEQRRRPLL